MNLLSKSHSRTAVAAVACAIVLAPAAALAAPSQGGITASASTPACTTNILRIWMGIPGEGAASNVYYPLELSNVSNQTCTLFGYPGVSALAPGGSQLGSAAARDGSDPSLLVTLSPGATAHELLEITAAGVFPPSTCQPENAAGLRVFPPNQTTATYVSFAFQACAKPGPVFLHVRTTVAGTGIPGYSR